MPPIREEESSLGSEYVEVDCFTCRAHGGLPKLLYKHFEGYGTGERPDPVVIQEAHEVSSLHNSTHDIVIFIGNG